MIADVQMIDKYLQSHTRVKPALLHHSLQLQFIISQINSLFFFYFYFFSESLSDFFGPETTKPPSFSGSGFILSCFNVQLWNTIQKFMMGRERESVRLIQRHSQECQEEREHLREHSWNVQDLREEEKAEWDEGTNKGFI